jgi:cytosine/adenosine deaminase-related metal-dependent hydrolase
MQPLTIRARWILTQDPVPMEGGAVVLHQGRVVGLVQEPARCDLDLGDAILVPRLINAHTHLEFSELEQPISAEFGFPGWVESLVERRRMAAGSQNEESLYRMRQDSLRRGLSESIESGTGWLVDNITPPWDFRWPSVIAEEIRCAIQKEEDLPLAKAIGGGLHWIGAAEVLCPVAEREAATWSWAESWCQQMPCNAGGSRSEISGAPLVWDWALAPHAPYTLPWGMLERLVSLSRQKGRFVTMHLAETGEEVDWLQGKAGPMAQMLERLTGQPALLAPSPSAARPIADYIRLLSQAPRALVVHGNVLDEPAMGELMRAGGRVGVVYCPRTHRHFGHAEHPWRKLHKSGVPVAVGTDSRASNPCLSVWEELRFLAGSSQEVDPRVLLAMATTIPGELLGLEAREGLYLGGPAPLVAFRSTATRADQLLEGLLAGGERPIPWWQWSTEFC